jgi:hypothetical protein
MMARSSISWKESDEASHRAIVEDGVSYTRQMLSLHLSEEHYMFLLVSELQARALNTDELYFTGPCYAQGHDLPDTMLLMDRRRYRKTEKCRYRDTRDLT